jgi:S1-C subfamily serine protease
MYIAVHIFRLYWLYVVFLSCLEMCREYVYSNGALAALDNSICTVVFKIVHHLDLDVFPGGGNAEQDIVCLRGVGVVIDAERGLILTDRGTVPQRLADIEVTLCGESRCATVWHMHPEHSIVVLKLDDHVDSSDPAEPNETVFGKAATFEQHDFEAGEDADFVGVDASGRRFSATVKIQTIRLGKFPRHFPPRWREKNLEAVILVEDPPDCTSGVLCDARGNIHALYAVVQAQDKGSQFRCGYGIPTHILQPVLNQLARPEGGITAPVVPSLEVEFQNVGWQKLLRLPSKLRPPAEWLQKLQAVGEKVLQVSAVTRTGPCHNVIEVGDLLVAVHGEPVATVHAVEAMLQKGIADAGVRQADSIFKLKLTALRQGVEREVEIMVPLLASDGSARVLLWHGLLLQETPRVVHESNSCSATASGVHISHTFLGSPADANSIMGDFLISVDGKPTPTLDAVVKLSSEKDLSTVSTPSSSCERHHLRVETADGAGRCFVSMLEPDPLFWPTSDISQDQQGAWSCIQRP